MQSPASSLKFILQWNWYSIVYKNDFGVHQAISFDYKLSCKLFIFIWFSLFSANPENPVCINNIESDKVRIKHQ